MQCISIDLDSLVQIAAVVKDAVLGSAAVIGAYVALRGLSTWNRQLKGGVEYELTRRILKCTYRLREAIKGVRHPVMLGTEMPYPDEAQAANMSREQIRFYGLSNAYQQRWDKVNEVRDDLQTELLEAEVIWGRAIHAEFEPIFELQRELFRAVHAYVSSSNPDESPEGRAVYQDIVVKVRGILYEVPGDKADTYAQAISDGINRIEAFLKPHLRK